MKFRRLSCRWLYFFSNFYQLSSIVFVYLDVFCKYYMVPDMILIFEYFQVVLFMCFFLLLLFFLDLVHRKWCEAMLRLCFSLPYTKI